MAYRALIIAIENYPKMTGGIAQTLPDVLAAGQAFKAWLEKKWKDEEIKSEDTQILFCSEPVVAGGREATLSGIRECLRELRDTGRNATEELYVFFGGHGFTFTAQIQGKTDYVLTSDCKRPDLTPECCLTLGGMVAWLRDHMGPGRHFYFVDACRNILDATKVVPGPLGLTFDSDASGEPSTFVLQSTTQGAVAAASDEFPKVLLEGLRGAGEAKAYSDALSDAMVVHFDSLTRYMGKALRQQTTSEHSGEVPTSDAVLTTLRPIPKKKLIVRVDGVNAGDTGRLLVGRDPDDLSEKTLTLPVTELQLKPARYFVRVAIKDGVVAPSGMVPVLLFENNAIAFTKTSVDLTGDPLDMAPEAPVMGGRGGLEAFIRAPAPALPAWSKSQAHQSIAMHFPHSDVGVDFSEQLHGEVTDMDLDLWLAILGAGRILSRTPGEYEKIGPLPLCDFSNEPVGASPIYVMAGLASDAEIEVRISNAPTTPGHPVPMHAQWRKVEAVPGMSGVRHLRLETTPGQKLFSFRLSDQSALTFASLTSPNRATLVTISIGEEGTVRASQFLLPLGHIIDHLPDEIRSYVKRRHRPLNDVRALATASRAFRQRSDIGKEMAPDQLDELLFAKWVDPIGSSLVAYQALRRGKKAEVAQAARNLMHFFPTLPDGAALARLAGLPDAPKKPSGVPLFLDGLRAYSDYADWLPLPAGLLDHSGPWTSWRGVS